jgi:hypothetical protein
MTPEGLGFNDPDPVAWHGDRYLGDDFRERIKRKKQR